MRHRVEVTPTTPYEDLPQFLTIQQAADYTQQSYYAVWQAVKAHYIPSRRDLSRKLILIPREHFAPRVPEAAHA